MKRLIKSLLTVDSAVVISEQKPKNILKNKEYLMKKMIFCVACAVLAVLTGCTSVQSTQKFNGLGLGQSDEKAVCLTHVTMTGYYFFGLPIFVGSAAEDGKSAAFRDNLRAERAIALLTREAKSKGAARVANVTVHYAESPVLLLPFLEKRIYQASGVGVRTKKEAVRYAQTEFED
jgi:hypothetical protein